MILLVDVGNSRIKWLYSIDGAFAERGKARHRGGWNGVLDRAWGPLPQPSRVVMVNVAGSDALHHIRVWAQRHWSVNIECFSSCAVAYGIENAYTEPEKLGADRFVGLIAARALAPNKHCTVIDCGTAVTIDALDAQGQHKGGVILPGMRLMRESLYRNTQQIPKEQGTPQLFGHNTRDAVWGGSLYTVVAAIDHITSRMEAGITQPGPRFLTGGDAKALLPLLQSAYHFEPDLLFHGLWHIACAEEGH